MLESHLNSEISVPEEIVIWKASKRLSWEVEIVSAEVHQLHTSAYPYVSYFLINSDYYYDMSVRT